MERNLREAIIVDYARRRPGAGIDDADGSRRRATGAAASTRSVHRRNPLCGDEVELRLDLSADDPPVVAHLRWEGRGCTVSQASAAMLAVRGEGLAADGLRRLSREVHAVIVDPAGDHGGLDDSDDLAALAGLGRLPLRARCAVLAWDALDEVLAGVLGLPASVVTGPDRARS
jgi:nitrogen fixation protein NifU and related proteins